MVDIRIQLLLKVAQQSAAVWSIPMHLVHTHCHLDVEFFDLDRDEVVARARAAGVTRIIVPAIKFENISRVLAMTDQYEGVYGAVGIYPYVLF